MQKLNERLMFLDNTLIMASTKKELIQVRDTLRFLLQTVGFLINKNKFELHSYQILQFLGVEINPNKNKCITSPIKEGQNYFKMSRHSKKKSIYIIHTRELTQELGCLSSTASAALVASNSKTTDSRTCKYKKI